MSAPPDLPGVEHSWVQAGDVRLHVARAGAGEPVVLLHGWPQHWWEWRGVIGPLAERYDVICPDLRGFGWSDAPPGAYAKEELAADIIALLDALGLERVRLVGHDWGGFIGFLLCLHHPERFERYLVLNTGHPWTSPGSSTLRHAWRFWYQLAIASPVLGRLGVGGRGQVFLRLLDRFNGDGDGGWSDRDTALFVDRLREPARARASQALYRTFVTRELPAMLRDRYDGLRLTTPALWLHGAADVVLRPEMLRGYERHADDLHLELVDGAGHFIADERPDLVAERALAFFA